MVHNVEFSCSHISFVWLHGLNSLQWWLLTCPDLTNVVWFKNNIDRHEYPKQLQAHPAKKSEIPDTRNTRWFWKKIGYGLGIAKNYRVGSGIGYPSGTGHHTCGENEIKIWHSFLSVEYSTCAKSLNWHPLPMAGLFQLLFGFNACLHKRPLSYLRINSN